MGCHLPAAPILHIPARPTLCSELARLGKEKLLFAARERLLGVHGRTSLLSPSVLVEPLLLPGAMALLHQVRCLGWLGAPWEGPAFSEAVYWAGLGCCHGLGPRWCSACSCA